MSFGVQQPDWPVLNTSNRPAYRHGPGHASRRTSIQAGAPRPTSTAPRTRSWPSAATLLAQEQTSFINAVNAYVSVIQTKQLLALQINNEQVLAKQLQATNDRFRVGEITRTDVAQAEAALEGARATRKPRKATSQTARGTFQQIRRLYPPDDLIEPQPLNLPVHSEQEAAALASINNPNVVTALFNDAAAKDAIDVAFAALLPQVSLQGQTFQQNNTRRPKHGAPTVIR